MRKNVIYSLIFFGLISCSSKKLIITPKSSERGDAVFSLIVPDNNYGKIADIHIYAWTQQGILNVNRVVIDFDLRKIPSTTVIDSAFLDLYFNYSSVYNKSGEFSLGNDSIIIQQITSEWNEKIVTWNIQPTTTTENQITIGKSEGKENNYENINVTQLIQDMANNNRYGLLLRHQNEKPYNAVYFASSDHPDKKLHPRLRVYYKKK